MRNFGWNTTRAGLSLLLGLFFFGGLGIASAQDRAERKLQRQIEVFEGIMNQVLVDSPNYLVPGRNAAHGLYLEGYGVVVSFSATLVDRKQDWGWGWLGGDVKVEREGDKIVIFTPEDKKKGDAGEVLKEIDFEAWQKQRLEKQSELYAAGKKEILEALLDYGDTMTSLKDDDRLVIAAFLGDNDFFQQEGLSRLVVTATMRDLRAVSDGRLSEKELEQKIRIDEY